MQKKKYGKACWENKTVDLAAVVFQLKGFSWLTHAKCYHQLIQEKTVLVTSAVKNITCFLVRPNCVVQISSCLNKNQISYVLSKFLSAQETEPSQATH